MDKQLERNRDRVAVVTGASSGIGLGITKALLEHGYRVAANSRTISKSKMLQASSELVLVDGDIGRKDTAVNLADTAVKHFGRIDLLVNSAGIYLAKPFTQYTLEDFDAMIATNIGGYFFITQQVVGQMRKQKSGHIVSISTVLTDQPLAGAPIALPVITKSTVPAFSRALMMEFLADGIRANTISPAVVDTPMHANDNHEQLKMLNPAGRLVQVSEIVDALLYLESAPMVNGENLRVDGGAHAGAKW
jgi:NAD(P)-dependent dehydrogenase (short-subunit alcohol dehydrogenase family)